MYTEDVVLLSLLGVLVVFIGVMIYKDNTEVDQAQMACAAKGGTYVRHYKSHPICFAPGVVLK